MILLLTSDPRDDPDAADAGTADWLAHLKEAMPEETIHTVWTDYDPMDIDIAVIVQPPPGSLAHLPNLVWIHSLWAGVETILADETIPPDIPIVRLQDPHMADTIAEAAAMHVLALHRKMPGYRMLQQQHTWKDLGYTETSETRIGILGLGLMGSAAARVIAMLGFQVMGWSRSTKVIENVQSFAGERGLADMVSKSNILVNLLPLTPETRGIMNQELFAMLPPNANVVNLGRGPHVDDDALLEALDTGRVAHAALDVFQKEPLPSDHPFWDHPSITITPHVAAPTGRLTGSRIVATNVRRYRTEGIIPEAVDRRLSY